MEKDKLKQMQEDALEIISEFNQELRKFTKKYPGFAVAICDSSIYYDGSKEYSAEILGKL